MAKTSSKVPANARKAKIQAAQQAQGSGPNKILIATVVAVVAIIAVVASVVIASQNSKSAATSTGNAVPAAAGAMGAGFVANKGVTLAPGVPTVDIYEDFQCPVCGQFEGLIGTTVNSLADAGKIKLVYHFKTIIDANFNNDFSLKAANANLCAADVGKFESYHHTVFSNQPATEGSGWTDTQLTAFAQDSGITGTALDTWKACFAAGTYDNYVRSTETASAKKGVNGTPTVFIGNVEQTLANIATPDAFTKAVTAATK